MENEWIPYSDAAVDVAIAIIGRPNVGKSTLFNRLVGQKCAIVHATPGVTRDWRVGMAQFASRSLAVIDTPGLEETPTQNTLTSHMMHHTQEILTKVDIGFFLIDAQQGLSSLDYYFADWVRQFDIPIILLANKAETRRTTHATILDTFALGLGEPIPISAEHGLGLADLAQALHVVIPDSSSLCDVLSSKEVSGKESEIEAHTTVLTDKQSVISMALVGRPNVGKSTLFNRLLGQDRAVTDKTAGTTRDAITAYTNWRDHRLGLVDTAGLRRRSYITEDIEKRTLASSVHAIRYAQIVVLVVDAMIGLDRQDLTIARMTIDQGRGLIIVINKADTIENDSMVLQRAWQRIEKSLSQVRGVPVLALSALYQTEFVQLMDTVLDVYERWNRRITTSQINRWLASALTHHPPPLVGTGKKRHRLKIRYMTQVKTRPPTFIVWLNRRSPMPQSYQRYLSQNLRETFNFSGIPIRLLSNTDPR